MLVALVACASPAPTTTDRAYDACSPLAVHLAEPTAAREAGLTEAFALWRDHGASRLETTGEPGDRTDNGTIELEFQTASGAFRGLYDGEHATIFINNAVTDPDVLAIVIAHELGHALGLVHVDGHASVMLKGNIEVTPNASDAASLEALWGACPHQ